MAIMHFSVGRISFLDDLLADRRMFRWLRWKPSAIKCDVYAIMKNARNSSAKPICSPWESSSICSPCLMNWKIWNHRWKTIIQPIEGRRRASFESLETICMRTFRAAQFLRVISDSTALTESQNLSMFLATNDKIRTMLKTSLAQIESTSSFNFFSGYADRRIYS